MDKGKVQLANIYLRYLCSIINDPALDNIGISIISIVCRCYVYKISFVRRIFGYVLQHGKSHSWIPLLNYPAGSNPIGILLEHKTTPRISELVKIMIEYCIDRAKATQDITYIMFLCEIIDELASQHPDLAIRVTRAFAYLRCTDKDSIIKYAKPIQHLSLSSLWSRKEISLDRCRNAILQVQSYESPQGNRAVDTFTEEIFVAPFSLLWIFILNRKAGHQEYCRFDPMATQSVFKNMFYLIKFYMNPLRHVYIRTNNYDLTILDNPSIEALIQYKWNTIGFKAWLIRFIFQCIYYILIVAAAAIQIYDPKPEPQLGVFIVIISFSGIFLWLEFLQWKDHLKASTPREKTKGERGILHKASRVIKAITKPLHKLSVVLTDRSPSKDTEEITDPKDKKENEDEEEDGNDNDTQDESNVDGPGYLFFRSQYELLDFFVYSMTFGTSVHHIIANGEEKRNSWDLSFCIIFVFLHMLSELRVSEVVCKYVTIVFGILNEIKVFFLVLAGGILFFSLAILHAVWAPGAETIIGGFPKEYHGAITTVIFIMGGRYDALSKNLMDENGEYLNWPLQILLLTYFFFAVVVMLNVLIALINVAYDRSDNNWRQAWLQNRLQIIVRAENLSYHIPGYRSSHDYFPDRIFYTATPYQVRQYWRRIKATDEGIILDAESKKEPTNSSVNTPASTDASRTPDWHTADKDGAGPNDPDPSSAEQKPTTAEGVIRQQAGKNEAFDMRTDMTKLKEGMAGMEKRLADLQEEISDVKGDIRAILAALITLQQSQARKE